MNFTSYIAKRYFFSKKSGKTVNIISGVSMLGILVGTAALIIVLSAFNGLESLVKGFYQSFDPDVKATLVEGKYTHISESQRKDLSKIEGVSAISYVLEERVMLRFQEKEYIASLKGVDEQYTQVSGVAENLVGGHFELWKNKEKQIPALVLGAGVSYYLGHSRSDFDLPISVFVPKENAGVDFSKAFSVESIYASAIFSIQPEFDEKYVLTALPFAQKILGRQKMINAVEFSVDGNIEAIQKQIKGVLGDAFKVQNREQQQEVFFKVMQSENLFTFLVFTLILAISTFTIMGTITMLILDKKENIFTLWAMGASIDRLRIIFFKEGMLISMIGAVSGLLIGISTVWLQEKYGILSVGQGYAIDAYPVALDFWDIPLVFFTVFTISSITSWLTARRLDINWLKKVAA